MQTEPYSTPSDALMHLGPGLPDYVTPAELDQLIDGTLAPAVIADRYYDDMGIADGEVNVGTDEAESRADLLGFVRGEIADAIQQRKDIARDEAMDEELQKLRTHDNRAHAEKLDIIDNAQALGATKAAIAHTLGISRVTLDKMLREREDRALFNEAIYTLIRRDMAGSDQVELFEALGIRDTSGQASVFLTGLSTQTLDDLREGERELLDRAKKRARELT
ncbi:hypothetical protein ACGFZA_07985 [Streptomyces sp. NPDC048211]|uniref:hypothetical protein n=1 Tax=Streptomyces sp. NPDC048211 TaxID=3365516 RepID=UPI00371E56DC